MALISITDLTRWYRQGQIVISTAPTKRGRQAKAWPIKVIDPPMLDELQQRKATTGEANDEISFKASVQGDGPALAAMSIIEALPVKISASELFRYGSQKLVAELGQATPEIKQSLAVMEKRFGIVPPVPEPAEEPLTLEVLATV